MSPPSARRNQWTLSAAAFERLLAAFSPSREEAARRYEDLRRRLLRYFIWERCPFPEERADEAFNRAARRLEEGEPVQNIEQYTTGVARLLAKESLAEQLRQERAYSGWAITQAAGHNGLSDSETEARCLEECLSQALSPADREFLLKYYEGDRSLRIRSRQEMAARLGIGMNALRNRALRLREKLETCLQQRLRGNGLDSPA
ncbi:MAG: sigma-70 family RNA polymerase sigma factor [Bryobacterales bacterium]|nr:sigma-70 family RNA polymerase sigma factor [Bryobacterales bacterium]